MTALTQAEITKRPQTIAELLASQKRQIAAALPKHLTPEKMLRIAMTEIRRNPELQKCTPQSLLGSVIQASQLGLTPDGLLGHAYLIPFRNYKLSKETGQTVTECQFMVGYRGMIELAMRSGRIMSLCAHEVYENDLFEFEYGLKQTLRHIPARSDRGAFVGVYAIAHFKDGGYQFEVSWKEDIDKVRAQSRGKDSLPWSQHYAEMAKKTAIRKLFKYLPVSTEMWQAITLDETADRGEQNNSLIIDMPEAGPTESHATKADKLATQLSQGEPNESH